MEIDVPLHQGDADVAPASIQPGCTYESPPKALNIMANIKQ